MANRFPSLFPLPLTPFEQFLLAEDRADYPACPVVTAELIGRLEEAAFRESVRHALKRHPLFQAIVRHRRVRVPVWEETTAEPEISFLTANEPVGGDRTSPFSADQFPRIDLTSEPGLRMRVVVGPERSTLFFQVHHCCADGPGMHRFLGDVLALYGQMTAYDDPPELLPLDPLTLRHRDQWPTRVKVALRSLQYWGGFLRSVFQFVTRRPAPLAKADSANGIPSIRAHTCYLERDEVRMLRRMVQTRQLTIHDVLAAELLQCARRWNEQRGAADRQLLRLVIPTDLRAGDRGRLPAANCLHIAFFGFRIREIRKTQDLAGACKAKMQALFESHSSTHFDLGLSMAALIPGLIGRLAPRSTRKGIAMLSSLGDPTRFYAAKLPRRDGRPVAGSLVLERLAVRSLVRPGTYLNISTSILADRLAISATVDEGHCGPDSAQFFAEEIRRRLVESLL